MKLLIVRHGDPDYANDTLTEIGKKEAMLLADKLEKLDIAKVYVSPLGRARDTAEYTLKRIGKTATVCDWLREFPPQVDKPNKPQSICWDWLPKDWVDEERFFDRERWLEPEVFAPAREDYRAVCEGLDKLLSEHGYERNGSLYNAKNANEDTIVFFCHFGLECVLLSHLLNISPMQLWHGFCAAPTSVTTLITEEREKGIAYFRMSSFGDTGHLYAKDTPPSFSARFCETYDNFEQRH